MGGNTFLVRIRGGMLEPLLPLTIPEGTLLFVTYSAVGSPEEIASRKSAGSWKGLVDADALIKDIYAGRSISTRPEPQL